MVGLFRRTKVATLAHMAKSTKKSMTYAGSGVDIEAGDAMVGMIKHLLKRTHGPRVLGGHGGFAGAFRLDYNEKLFKRNYKDPVLVSCTDGVGTKVKLATQLNIYDTVGIDLVAMSINDLIVCGAEPLFFLDYIAVSKLEPQQSVDMVKGVSDGCKLSGCALLGGETAEMPDVYAKGEFDLAGFAVGVCELHKFIDGSRVQKGDVVLGLASSGIHSNGYSLVRAVIDENKLDLNKVYPELDKEKTLGRVVIEPTRIYAKAIVELLHQYRVKQVVTAMAHITGGGLVNNLNRVLPNDLDAVISRKAWKVSPIFKFLKKHGNIKQGEMDRVFNQGIGYCVVVKPAFAEAAYRHLTKSGETVFQLGTITKGSGKVKITA